jgi:2-oxoglutarate dehydrogenase E2 component (dihydrolipoamide succinyltransferase)
MAKFEVVMPKLGESIIEATITKWLKNEGDAVGEDEAIVEIATDKVDSEIPSPVEGILVSKLFKEGDVVAVGKVIAVIDLGGEEKEVPSQEKAPAGKPEPARPVAGAEKKGTTPAVEKPGDAAPAKPVRFYSPLVRNIAKQENISLEELERIPGTGKGNRLTRQDLAGYLKTRGQESVEKPAPAPSVAVSGSDQIIEMDRIRQLIAGHMVRSVQTSPHVTSFVEADVTNLVRWREKMKEDFFKRESIKLTYTPVFIEAIAKAVRENPMINVSVDGTRIRVHRNINIGMAVALPNFNLIVPVIRDADRKGLLGIIREVTDLAERARLGKLVPDEIMGGTLSLTNLGSFGTLAGTPIINQPQAAIVAVGSIRKRPVVVEGKEGDMIAVRSMMIASLTFDHRVIDGELAGIFLNRLVWHLEHFDTNQNL